MIDLLRFILSNITDHPEDIKIDIVTDAANTQTYNVAVHPEDMGKVIGKGGKIISAIRELVRIKAIKLNQRVKVVLLDQINPSVPPAFPEPQPQKSEN